MDLAEDFYQHVLNDMVLAEDTRVVYHRRMSRTDESKENDSAVEDRFFVLDKFVSSDRGPYLFTRTEDAQKVRVMYFDCTIPKGKKPLRCTICWCVFEKYWGLLTHWKQQHGEDQASGYVMVIDCEAESCRSSVGQSCQVTWMLETDPEADLRDHRQMRIEYEFTGTTVISKRFLYKRLVESIDTKWREHQKIEEQRLQAIVLEKQRRQRHLQHLDNRARPKFEPCPWPYSKPESNDDVWVKVAPASKKILRSSSTAPASPKRLVPESPKRMVSESPKRMVPESPKRLMPSYFSSIAFQSFPSAEPVSFPSAEPASLPPSFSRKRKRSLRRRNRTNSGVVRIDDGADEGSKAEEKRTTEAACRTNASRNVAVLRRNSSEKLGKARLNRFAVFGVIFQWLLFFKCIFVNTLFGSNMERAVLIDECSSAKRLKRKRRKKKRK